MNKRLAKTTGAIRVEDVTSQLWDVLKIIPGHPIDMEKQYRYYQIVLCLLTKI